MPRLESRPRLAQCTATPSMILFSTASIFTLLCTLSVVYSQQNFTVSGTVSGPDGLVAGAQVTLRGYDRFSGATLAEFQTTTDAQGKFIGQVPAGKLDLKITPPTGSGLLEGEVRSVDISQDTVGRFTLFRPVTLSYRIVCPEGTPGNIRVDIYSLTSDRSYNTGGGCGIFQSQVAPDFYSIHATSGGRDFYFGRVNVDARKGDIRDAVVTVQRSEGPILTTAPPTASRISISPADENGTANVTGLPGAVEGMSAVMVANLQTQQVNFTVSAPDGSFSAPMFAPPGSFVQVKYDPTGRYLPRLSFNGTISEVAAPPGAILFVPPTSASGSGTSFAAVSVMNYYEALQGSPTLSRFRIFGSTDPGRWWLSGEFDRLQWNPGESITLRGKLIIYSKNITSAIDLAKVRVDGFLSLERLFDGEGNQRQPNHQFLSSIMTPTGFPIERFGNTGIGGNWKFEPLRPTGDNRLETSWTLSFSIPLNTPSGLYRPRLGVNVQGITTGARYFDFFPSIEGGNNSGRSSFPTIRIGSPKPPRLSWVLGLNNFSNGSRGSIALEDRGKFQVASHVMTSTDAFIVPPKDERTGAPLRYRLEPFVPMIANSTARLTDAPLIPFRFPSGSLRVKVIKPDGTSDDLGSAPFAQSMSRTPLSKTGQFISSASSSVTDFYELTTLDPRFEYVFTQYGRHEVIMTGTIEDIWGNVYEGGGTYEVFVGKTLDLETGVMPGTPFEVGDLFSPAVIVQPGIPAEVEVKFKLLPNSDTKKGVERVIRGRANRFGYFNPITELIGLTDPGEYRVDITARYVDDQGVFWMGAVSWGSVIETPGSTLITHGRRGFDGVNQIQQQWFRVREARAGGDHAMFPFHRGDVMWMQKDDPAADIPKITVQDPEGKFAERIRLHNRQQSDGFEGPSLEERITAGEIPLFSTTGIGQSPSFAPEAVDQWSYFYASVERPGVHVREFISEDQSRNGYWRFNDNYHFQLGNGIGGDLPNDFKFQFGGAVYRDTKDNFYYYGAYASLFVLLPFQDAQGGRVFPPFQGNGGGPSGGPIMRLKGKEIDIFFHPTGTRPGSILETGELVSFAGQIGPTLPSKVEITVTSPTNRVRSITGQANKIGYVYKPAGDFVADEPGPWRVKVKVWHDGLTSAGQVQPPFPTGDVFGSTAGEFYFYVVDGSSRQLGLNVQRDSFVRPAEKPVSLTIAPDAALKNTQLYYTTIMPGFILEEGTKSDFNYSYDAVKLNKDFPNLDLFDADGFAGVDTITMSFLVSGTDATGKKLYQARQVLLQGEELLALTPRPRRRP